MLGKVTKELFDQLIDHCNNPQTRTQVEQKLVDPLIAYLYFRVKPYLQFLGLFMAIIIFLLVLSIFMNMRRNF
jgi:hypothetical protein